MELANISSAIVPINSKNNSSIAISSEKVLKKLRSDREAHKHKQIWTKDAHGGPYRKANEHKGYDPLIEYPDGTKRTPELGYERAETGPTTNFVGNHMTQGAIDLVQAELEQTPPSPSLALLPPPLLNHRTLLLQSTTEQQQQQHPPSPTNSSIVPLPQPTITNGPVDLTELRRTARMLKKGKKGSGGGATKQSTTTTTTTTTTNDDDSKLEVRPSFDTLTSVNERARQAFDKGQYAQCLEILLSSQGDCGSVMKETKTTTMMMMMMCCDNNNKQVMFTVIDSLELSSKCNKGLGSLRVASEELSTILDILEMNINSSSGGGGGDGEGDELMRGVVRVRVLASRAVLYEEMERWGDALGDWTDVLSIVEKGGGGGGGGGGMEMMMQRAVLGRGRAKKFVAEKKR